MAHSQVHQVEVALGGRQVVEEENLCWRSALLLVVVGRHWAGYSRAVGWGWERRGRLEEHRFLAAVEVRCRRGRHNHSLHVL